VGAEERLNLITQVEFARQLEISKQAVQDAKKRGALGMNGKKIDLDSPVTKDYVAGALERRDKKREIREQTGEPLPKNVIKQRTKKEPKPRKPYKRRKKGVVLPPDEDENHKKSIKRRKTTAKSPPTSDPPMERPTGQKLEDVYSESDNAETKYHAEIAVLRQRKLNLELKNRKERKKLVERNLVEIYDAKTAAIDAQELLTLGQRIAANIAAAFKMDDPEAKIKCKKIIDKEVFSSLDHKKRMRKDFLESIADELG
jgi:hypothetical protein